MKAAQPVVPSPNVLRALGCMPVTHKLSVVMHACNSSAWKIEAGGSQVRGCPQLQRELEAYLAFETLSQRPKTEITKPQLFSLQAPLLTFGWVCSI